MAGALKKLLAKLALGPSDVITLAAPLGAPSQTVQDFARAVHEETGHVVLITTPGFRLDVLTDEQIHAAGMIRIAPAELEGATVDELEEQAHAVVRRTYQQVREQLACRSD